MTSKFITAEITKIDPVRQSHGEEDTYQLVYFKDKITGHTYKTYIKGKARNRDRWIDHLKVGITLSNLRIIYGDVIDADSEFKVVNNTTKVVNNTTKIINNTQLQVKVKPPECQEAICLFEDTPKKECKLCICYKL